MPDSGQSAQEAIPVALTIRDISKRLQLSELTVWRLIRGGELPAKRIGGRVRVGLPDFERWFDEQTYASPGAKTATNARS